MHNDPALTVVYFCFVATQVNYQVETLDVAGWIVPLLAAVQTPTLNPRSAVFYSVYDAAYSYQYWVSGSRTNTTTNVYAFAFMNAWSTMMAALSNANSTSASDMRAAFLSLNGEVAFLNPIRFDLVTGVNLDQAVTIAQADGNGAFNTTAASAGYTTLVYPYDWPWHPVQIGDKIFSSISSSAILVAVVIAILGAWVASIVVEQSVHVRRKGGLWQLWLMVVAASIGGVAVWCSELIASTGLTVSKTSGGSALPMNLALSAAFLGLLPALLLTWMGLVVLICDVENQTLHGGRASQAQQALREQREAKKKKAALNFVDHIFHLMQCITWRIIVGGLLVAAALSLTRLAIFDIWVTTATKHTAGRAWVTTTILETVLVPIAMLIYFHALRWRVAGVFLLAGCVLQDFLIQATSVSWYYAATVPTTPSFLYVEVVSSTEVELLAGILAAVICLIFVGLQFSRMQLSRNGLAVLVACLEQVNRKQKDTLNASISHNSFLRQQLDVLSRMLDFIALNTPQSTE